MLKRSTNPLNAFIGEHRRQAFVLGNIKAGDSCGEGEKKWCESIVPLLEGGWHALLEGLTHGCHPVSDRLLVLSVDQSESTPPALTPSGP